LLDAKFLIHTVSRKKPRQPNKWL